MNSFPYFLWYLVACSIAIAGLFCWQLTLFKNWTCEGYRGSAWARASSFTIRNARWVPPCDALWTCSHSFAVPIEEKTWSWLRLDMFAIERMESDKNKARQPRDGKGVAKTRFFFFCDPVCFTMNFSIQNQCCYPFHFHLCHCAHQIWIISPTS